MQKTAPGVVRFNVTPRLMLRQDRRLKDLARTREREGAFWPKAERRPGAQGIRVRVEFRLCRGVGRASALTKQRSQNPRRRERARDGHGTRSGLAARAKGSRGEFFGRSQPSSRQNPSTLAAGNAVLVALELSGKWRTRSSAWQRKTGIGDIGGCYGRHTFGMQICSDLGGRLAVDAMQINKVAPPKFSVL
jgi:hypothetical protein